MWYPLIKDAVCILEKFWSYWSLRESGTWLACSGRMTLSWLQLVFRQAWNRDDQRVRDFKQIAIGGEWRDTLSLLSCLPSIFCLSRLLVLPWPEAWWLSSEWRHNLICHGSSISTFYWHNLSSSQSPVPPCPYPSKTDPGSDSKVTAEGDLPRRGECSLLSSPPFSSLLA